MSVEKHEAEARRWLKQAFADRGAAEASLASGHFEWACFQAQQAAEKALKALWFLVVPIPGGTVSPDS